MNLLMDFKLLMFFLYLSKIWSLKLTKNCLQERWYRLKNERKVHNRYIAIYMKLYNWTVNVVNASAWFSNSFWSKFCTHKIPTKGWWHDYTRPTRHTMAHNSRHFSHIVIAANFKFPAKDHFFHILHFCQYFS